MKTSSHFLSLVIPVYNESNRINGLRKIIEFLKCESFSSELIVVDDGSTDDTYKQLLSASQKYPFEIIRYAQNRGKGYALKQGMLKASGEYILFSDIDLSTPLDEFKKFIPFLAHYDLVIGSRKMKHSTLVKRQPKLRETLGKGFTFLSSLILQVDVSDFTCGFKCFNKVACREIFSRVTIDRWGFDSEILFLSKKLNYSIKEIPVVWENDPSTKVKFPQDIIKSLSDLLKIKYKDLHGLYK